MPMDLAQFLKPDAKVFLALKIMRFVFLTYLPNIC